MHSPRATDGFLFSRLRALQKAEAALERKYRSLSADSALELAMFAAAVARLNGHAELLDQHLDSAAK